jgi:hypothetical protein
LSDEFRMSETDEPFKTAEEILFRFGIFDNQLFC